MDQAPFLAFARFNSAGAGWYVACSRVRFNVAALSSLDQVPNKQIFRIFPVRHNLTAVGWRTSYICRRLLPAPCFLSAGPATAVCRRW